MPADLTAVTAFVVLTNLAVLLPVVSETSLRVVVGLPFVLFVPGYAFIAALFPEAGDGPQNPDEADQATDQAADAETASVGITGRDGGIDGIERVALSFGLSIAIVPLLGLVLNFTPWGIRLVPILISVSAFTLGATAVAARRRWTLPPAERFRVPYRQWMAAGRAELFEPETRGDAALNVSLVLSVVLASGSVAYAVGVPKQGESFTEFYLLTEGEDGELVADGYPREFTLGENRSLVVGIANQEHERTEYSVLVELQRVQVQNNSTTVLESQRLRRFETTLAHNESWQREYAVQPTMPGQRLWLAFLLYRGSVPAAPSVENAYRETHLWINVTDS